MKRRKRGKGEKIGKREGGGGGEESMKGDRGMWGGGRGKGHSWY